MNDIGDVAPTSAHYDENACVLSTALVRLNSLLIEENGLLESGASSDHSTYIVSKNQVLRELMVLQKTMNFSELGKGEMEQLKETRKLVDRNHHLLKLQISALNDVTSFLTKTAILEQGDGTYTREKQ